MLFADSLVNGFLTSNLMGRALVVIQIIGSVVMLATIVGKAKELAFVGRISAPCSGARFVRQSSLILRKLKARLGARTIDENVLEEE